MNNSKIKGFFFAFLLFVLLLPTELWAQITSRFPLELGWKGVKKEVILNDTLLIIDLESGSYQGVIPTLALSKPIYDDAVEAKVELQNVKSVALSAEEAEIVSKYAFAADYVVDAVPLRSRDEALLSISVLPFRQSDGRYEKLISAEVVMTLAPKMGNCKSVPAYAHQSVLASGEWHKLGLKETGIYKLTFSDLKSIGLDVQHLDPRDIRIYHNGGGVLPEMNAEPRHDDLVELPIQVVGESDGSFDANDYVLFYAGGPVGWKYDENQKIFKHTSNSYDDYSYAFLTVSLGRGKRISEEPSAAAANHTVTAFLDYALHESDEINLNHWGRTYYGDKMTGNATKDFSFSFSNADRSRQASLVADLAGRNFTPANYQVYVNGQLKATYSIETTTSNDQKYAVAVGGTMPFFMDSDVVKVTLKHGSSNPNTTSDGYVNYLSLNVWRNLVFSGSQMLFRNPEVESGKTYEYRLSGASQQVQVWDVTNPVAPQVVKGQLNASTLSFRLQGNPSNEFIAFNGQSYYSAVDFGKVANQNLHAVRDVDFVILTHPNFMSQAERLKDFHAVHDPDLNVLVTTTELIYNEFSCGAKDITAIRDFCRMLYLDSNAGREIKYLLLMGDASFDQKNRSGLVDFVPAYETVASINGLDTYVTDDYFGFFDENEGNINASLADIGIGRFPIQTVEQASQMIDKIEQYVERNENTMQPWRNVVTFVTDDDHGFVDNAEKLADSLQTKFGGADLVIDKIYLDAYNQISTPNGELAPEVNAAINNRMEKGTLVMNYTGHGGEVQLSEERILQRKDVDSWRNSPMFPMMITGTCEFSRYDDNTRTSLGEYSFLNQYGGMIAMFTTSRATYSNDNMNFNHGVYRNLFRINGGELTRIGDVYRRAKSSGYAVEKRYVLFGDPALRINYPKWSVETVSMPDTIKALQPVEIKGVVKDLNGHLASGFNGVVYVTVYDKESRLATKGTATSVIEFNLFNSVVFNGKTDVVNGEFSINFTVPRDISYRFGTGMVSYYATNYDVDAKGSKKDFVIGGFYKDAKEDTEPPAIRLFIDDTLFVDGGITGENPLLLAFVEDESGINTTGSGIGHDIVATLDGPSKETYCLNDYFISDLGNPGKGQISFKMLGLADGEYTLNLKVWDVFNNSNIATVHFVVINSETMRIENPANLPNPVTDGTRFVFDHNQIGNNVDVKIYIYDIMGRLVEVLSEQVAGTSARTSPIYWNPGELRNGLYVYRIVATNDKGETATAVSKLVLSR
ncbi:MAG: type IX secretion system sortase PorU [Bacteroidales bacterium]|nr:type IX secretion system sortase PorU [Bacteroidales bacterium]